VKVQRTSIGLDVHARSVVACGLDGDTGEVFQRRLCPDHREVLEWIGGLPAPVAVTYEAGPTGFGLARFLLAAGIMCLVAAPSKLQRPAGDRVKTDARDAAHLARLLHLGQITEVTVPSVAQEAARDLVQAREDCRGDLMGARHRLSKLLLRQGIVYYGGQAWTGKHELWLRAQRFDNPALTLAYEVALDAMVACPRGVLTRHQAQVGGATRSQGGVTKTGNGHARRLFVEAAGHHRAPYRPSRDLRRRWGHRHPDRAYPRPRCQPPAAHPLGRFRPAQETPRGRQRRDRPRAGRLVLVVGRHARLSTPHRCPDEQPRCRQASWSDPRLYYEQSHCTATDHARSLDQRPTPTRKFRPAVTNPRISE
jgi:transposase